MITVAEAVRSAFGAYRLARFDRGGLGYLDCSPSGAARSFYCALILLPPLALIRAINLAQMQVDAPVVPLLLMEALGYVIKWTAFPVLVSFAAGVINRRHRFTHFVSAYNWSNLVWVAVLFPLILLTAGGLLPGDLGYFLIELMTLVLLVYEWFVLRVSLEVTGAVAFALVIADLVLSLKILDWADSALMAAVP